MSGTERARAQRGTEAAAPNIAELAPTVVWRHFADLCRIPRRSKHEAALRDFLRAWADGRGLATAVDAAGNLIVRKRAAAGRERSPGVVLQAHLDMVCEKNADVDHDFDRDPIRGVLEDGWLRAERTTLGADNGLGVALILAALEQDDLRHGPLEALFTVDEEAGMGGARGLASGLLQGRLMLNLDTEEWGEFYVGCAGGIDVNVARGGRAEPIAAGWTAQRIVVRGLRGGHSGIDIQRGRGNAIKLLVRILGQLAAAMPLRLVSLAGGTARNALPREAAAVVAVAEGGESLRQSLAQWEALLRDELAGVDDGLRIETAPAVAERVMSAAEQAVWLQTLNAAPHGVKRLAAGIAEVVETSNNLGMVDLRPEGGSCNFLVRSLRNSSGEALAQEIVSLWALSGTRAELAGQYAGWTPNPGSPLLALCRRTYEAEFGSAAAVKVIHAGLECGLIVGTYPDMDIVSFGPTIRGAHAPGEAAEIASVGRAWQLLRAILEAIA